MATNAHRLLNSALQAINLIARFALIFFLAKYIDPVQVGYFGIFAATVSYALYFVGLDYYIYVSREIIKKNPEERGRLLKGQALLSVALYAAFIPLAVIYLPILGWPAGLTWWFFPILVLEHFNQEMTRLLIALAKPISATVILFIRQGAWSVVMVVAMVLSSGTRNLDLLMSLWAVSGLIAASFAILKLRALAIAGWSLPVDWGCVKKGVLLSLTFLIGTLALRGIQTFDRYWVERLAGIEAVGAYVLLYGIASTLLVFLESALFSFSYPRLIQLSQSGEHSEARAAVKRLFLQALCLAVLFGIASWFILPYLLRWIGNPVYIEAIDLYPLLLLAIILNALSMVPHYALYALGVDRPIVYSHFAALIFFVAATWMAGNLTLKYAVPIGLCFAFGLVFIWKTAAYFISISTKPALSHHQKN